MLIPPRATDGHRSRWARSIHDSCERNVKYSREPYTPMPSDDQKLFIARPDRHAKPGAARQRPRPTRNGTLVYGTSTVQVSSFRPASWFTVNRIRISHNSEFPKNQPRTTHVSISSGSIGCFTTKALATQRCHCLPRRKRSSHSIWWRRI